MCCYIHNFVVGHAHFCWDPPPYCGACAVSLGALLVGKAQATETFKSIKGDQEKLKKSCENVQVKKWQDKLQIQ